MKIAINIFILILSTLVLGCANSKNLDNSLPIGIGKVYYHELLENEVRPSGFSVVIPVLSNEDNLKLDSVYFHGQQSKLKLKDKVYIGNFEYLNNLKHDFIMSNAPYAEYGNKAPRIIPKRALGLSKNEALVSYNVENKTNYFKISNIVKKEL